MGKIKKMEQEIREADASKRKGGAAVMTEAAQLLLGMKDVPLHTSDEKKMETLRDYLTNHGIFTTIRASRGQDIFAACGLLSTSKKNAEM